MSLPPPLATLYYSKNSSGAANFIAAYKAGILGTKLVAYEVELFKKVVLTGPDQGESFYDINPKGNVPTIILEDEEETLLNENGSCLQWILDNAVNPIGPQEFGTKERFLLQTKLSFLSAELHNLLADVYKPTTSDAAKAYLTDKLKRKLQFLNDQELKQAPEYYAGSYYTVADSYLFFLLQGCQWVGIDLSVYPNAKKYFDGIEKLPFIAKAQALMDEASPPPVPEALGTLFYSCCSRGGGCCSGYMAAYKAGILGTKLNACKVDLKKDVVLTGSLKGTKFSTVDSKASLPTIVLVDGTVFNQNVAVLQWILENAVDANSIGFGAKTSEQYAMQSKLSFVAADLDTVLQDFLDGAAALDGGAKGFLTTKLLDKIKFLNDFEFKDGREFWVGGKYSVADTFLFSVLDNIHVAGISLDDFSNVKRYFDGIASLEFIQEAKKELLAV